MKEPLWGWEDLLRAPNNESPPSNNEQLHHHLPFCLCSQLSAQLSTALGLGSQLSSQLLSASALRTNPSSWMFATVFWNTDRYTLVPEQRTPFKNRQRAQEEIKEPVMSLLADDLCRLAEKLNRVQAHQRCATTLAECRVALGQAQSKARREKDQQACNLKTKLKAASDESLKMAAAALSTTGPVIAIACKGNTFHTWRDPLAARCSYFKKKKNVSFKKVDADAVKAVLVSLLCDKGNAFEALKSSTDVLLDALDLCLSIDLISDQRVCGDLASALLNRANDGLFDKEQCIRFLCREAEVSKQGHLYFSSARRKVLEVTVRVLGGDNDGLTDDQVAQLSADLMNDIIDTWRTSHLRSSSISSQKLRKSYTLECRDDRLKELAETLTSGTRSWSRDYASSGWAINVKVVQNVAEVKVSAPPTIGLTGETVMELRCGEKRCHTEPKRCLSYPETRKEIDVPDLVKNTDLLELFKNGLEVTVTRSKLEVQVAFLLRWCWARIPESQRALEKIATPCTALRDIERLLQTSASSKLDKVRSILITYLAETLYLSDVYLQLSPESFRLVLASRDLRVSKPGVAEPEVDVLKTALKWARGKDTPKANLDAVLPSIRMPYIPAHEFKDNKNLTEDDVELLKSCDNFNPIFLEAVNVQFNCKRTATDLSGGAKDRLVKRQRGCDLPSSTDISIARMFL